MAAESIDGFGSVSRVKDVVFRNALLLASVAGVASLAVLLAYVFVDAIGPLSADPLWFAAVGGLFVLPIALTVALVRRAAPEALGVGVTTLGAAVGGVLLAGATSVVFVDVLSPLGWLGLAVGLALPAAGYLLYRRVRPSAGLAERAVVAAVAFGYSLVGVPGYLHSAPEMVQKAPVVPTEWTIMLGTLGLGGALAVGHLVAARLDDRRAGLVVTALTFGIAAAGGVAGLLLGDATAGVGLAFWTVALPAAYAAVAVRERPAARVGFALPAAVVAGLVLTAVAVRALGVAGPASWLDWQFLTSLPSPTPEEAGVYAPLVGSVLLMAVVVLLSFPVGVGAALYLEEYAPNNRYTRFIQVNISNLAGVPSVVYGLLGLGIFINFFGMNAGSLLVGGLTLSLLILPIVIISAQEAIRSVPDSMRQASYGMGATRWQTVRNVVLPEALPGILTGTILAVGRALGEAAPLIMIAAPTVSFSVPTRLSDATSAMPLTIFEWAFRPEEAFRHGVLAAGVVTLLVVLLAINSVAILVRNRYQRET